MDADTPEHAHAPGNAAGSKPVHGTRARYRQGCRCAACRAANTRYEKRRQLAGSVDLVDAGPVRAHLAALQRAGSGPKAISESSGISLSLVNRLLGRSRQRPATRMRAATAEALLRVPVGTATPGTQVNAAGTTRRLRALVAAGWPQAEIARQLSWPPSTVQRLCAGRQTGVTLATASRVARLYRSLAQQTGPSSVAATRAWLDGWAPPDSWAPRSIDDPDACPHGASLLRLREETSPPRD